MQKSNPLEKTSTIDPQRGPFSWSSQLGTSRQATRSEPSPGTLVTNLSNLRDQSVMVVGESWKKMQEYNSQKPPPLKLSQFARVISDQVPMEGSSPLIPVQLFVQNSVDPTGQYHEGKPIYVRTPTERNPHDTLPLTDLRPLTAIYRPPLTNVDVNVLVNTLQQNLSVRLCALENEDWFSCRSCEANPGWMTEAELEKKVDGVMGQMTNSLSPGIIRFCHFSCPDLTSQIAPECGHFTIAVLRDKEATRFLLLPSDNDLEYKLFVLGRYNIPGTLDAIHAVNWARVPLYQRLREAALRSPTPCGPPRDAAFVRDLVVELVRRGYTCQTFLPKLDVATKKYLFERSQLLYPY